MKRLRVLRSHAAHFRFLSACRENGPGEFGIVGWVPRSRDWVRQPYSFGPTQAVYSWGDPPAPLRSADVVVLETSHKRFEVFHVVQEVYATEAAAEAAYVARRKAVRS